MPRITYEERTSKLRWKPLVSFFVPGRAAAGGSKSAFTFEGKDGKLHARVVDSGKGNSEWKALVARYAGEAMDGREPTKAPVRFSMTFYRDRPRSHYTPKGELGSQATPFPLASPDVSKTVRSTEDALKKIVWTDDSIVVKQYAEKEWCDPSHPNPGVMVTIEHFIEGTDDEPAQ